MIKQIAFLLLVFLILGAGASAAPTVTPGGPYSGHRNANIDLNGYATDAEWTITAIAWNMPVGSGCTIVNEFISVSGDQNRNDAVITCTDVNAAIDVNLVVDNNNGERANSTASLAILNQAPTAALTVSPGSGNPGVVVTLTGFCQDLDGNGTISTCSLEYGDGNTEAIAGPAPYFFSKTHTYYQVGTAQAKLAANDDKGANGQDIEPIAISALANAAPVASGVSISPSSPRDNDTLTCNYTYGDTEGNAEGATAFLWFKGGAPQASQVSRTLISSQTSVGESWICQVRPIALTGTITGVDVNSGAVTIGNIATPVISSSTHEEDVWKASDDVTFSWTDISGATYYYIFDTASDTVPSSGNDTWTSTSKSFYDQSNGVHYLHVRAKIGDEWSGTDHYKVKIDDSEPGVPTGLSASYDSDDEDVYLDWASGGDSGGSDIKYYKIYRGTVSGFDDMSKIGETTGNGTEYSSYSSLTEGKRYYYRVVAVDAAGNESVESDYVSVIYGADAPKPTVKFASPLDNEAVKGVFTIKASATADSSTSIKEVRFYIDESLIGKATKSGSYYVLDWNTLKEADGVYELKATAVDLYDVSSNPDAIDVKIGNGAVQDANRAAAETAIGSAEDSKENVDAIVAEFASLGVLPGETASGLISGASGLLVDAKAAFDGGKYVDAKKKANDAKAKLVQAVGMLAVEDYGEASDYVFNKEHLDIMLRNLGFSQQLRDEAKELLQGNEVARSLSFKKIEDGDKAYYKAVITLVVKNNSDEAMAVKVVEIIPKELASSASGIAGSGFVVLVEDPVLEWAVSLGGAGEEKEIVYALKGELTAEEADDMIASGIINKFSAPPVLLKAKTSIGPMFSPVSAGLFGLGGTVEIVGLAIIIGAIVVFAVLYIAGRRGRSEGNSVLDAAASRAGFGSGFFGKLGKNNEPSGPKWRYKGV